MKALIPLAILLAAALFLGGCAQARMPKECESRQGASLESCVYKQAVMAQEPFYCYSISDMEKRVRCLKDATDTAMQKKVQNLRDDEEIEIPAEPANPPQEPPAPPPQQNNGAVNTAEIDGSIYAVAVASNDLQLCEQIFDPKIVKSCISQIAQKTKNPELCVSLTSIELVELCNLYSLGN